MEQTAHATLNASEVLILVVRTSVVLWCTALSFAAWRWPVGARWPIRYQLAAWFVIRLCGLVFLVFFSGLRLPGDIVAYKAQANLVLEGQMPNRDFATPYGWLFTYLLAGPLLIANHAFSIALLFQVCEFVGLALVLRGARRFLTAPWARNACLLYLLNPAIVVCYWFGLQEEVLLILGLGLLTAMLGGGRDLAKGIAAGVLFHATKLLSLWSIFPFLLVKRPATAIGFALAFLGIFGLIALAGASPVSFKFSRGWQNDPAVPDDDISHRITYGNAWYLASRAVPLLKRSPVPNLVALVALAAAAFVVWRAARSGIDPAVLVLSSTGLFTLVFLVFGSLTPPYFMGTAVLALLVTLPKREEFRKYLPWLILWTAVALVNYNLGALHFRMTASSVSIPAWFSTLHYGLQVPQILLTAMMAWIAARFVCAEGAAATDRETRPCRRNPATAE